MRSESEAAVPGIISSGCIISLWFIQLILPFNYQALFTKTPPALCAQKQRKMDKYKSVYTHICIHMYRHTSGHTYTPSLYKLWTLNWMEIHLQTPENLLSSPSMLPVTKSCRLTDTGRPRCDKGRIWCSLSFSLRMRCLLKEHLVWKYNTTHTPSAPNQLRVESTDWGEEQSKRADSAWYCRRDGTIDFTLCVNVPTSLVLAVSPRSVVLRWSHKGRLAAFSGVTT